MNWHTFIAHIHTVVLSLILCKVCKYETAPVGQNYVIIIDAGSSGSRMFVYTWQIKAQSVSGLEDVEILKDKDGKPVIKKQTPGLSSFSDKLDEIPKYISSLLDIAVLNIPVSAQPSTPLFIMATAGMRLLPPKEQKRIWEAVQQFAKFNYRFSFRESDAYTISGTEEGLFGWIAVNYLLGRFRPVTNNSRVTKQPTDGMLDMGGASMQIAYEIQSTNNLPGNSVSEFTVRKKCYLGYGMNALRQRYEEYLLYIYVKHHGTGSTKLEIQDPCLLKDFTVQGERVPHPPPVGTPPEPTGTGNMDQCMQNVEPLLILNKNCAPIPCAMNNVVQPNPDFNSMEFYGLSEFYYTLETLKMIPPVQYSYPLAMSEAKRICGKRWDNYYSELKKENPHLPQQKFESFVSFKKLICFKASYLLSAFHKGLHFPTNYQQLHPALEINNIELQWSLGALLYKLTASTSEEEYNRKVAIILIVVAIILLISAVLGFVLYSVLRKRCSRIPKQSTVK
ncbi:unnamed protein product [Heterobilharzia americana]|nr:unnamed protein product [Heterobilharzia americana]